MPIFVKTITTEIAFSELVPGHLATDEELNNILSNIQSQGGNIQSITFNRESYGTLPAQLLFCTFLITYDAEKPIEDYEMQPNW